MRRVCLFIITCVITSPLWAQIAGNKDSLLSACTLNIKANNWDTLYLRTSRKPNFYLSDTQYISLKTPEHPKFQMPIPGNVISEFGYRSRRRVHTGVDVKLNHGDSVYCAFDGIVRISRNFSGYGNIVVVRHYNGLETAYAHLSKRLVRVGDTLQCGQVLGLGGRTGRATTDHLHFETRYREQPFNPRLMIDFTTKKLVSDTLLLSQNSFSFGDKKKTKKARHPKVTNGDKKDNTNKNIIAQQESSVKIRFHVIQKGDTLYSLAKRYDTTVDELCRVNHIQENGILSLGQKLMIP